MKTLKFRAWNKTDKTMGEPFTLQTAIGSRKHDGVDTTDIVYMQFTGLLDKHGKAIYEGDILDCDWNAANNFHGKDRVLYVVQDVREFYYDVKEGKVSSDTQWIIGNIYESPDLL